MSFSYNYTCPDVDRGIEAFQDSIESQLENMLDECCPMLKDEQRKKFISEYVDVIYDDFQSYFEDVRESNSDMRKEAECQIDDIERDLEESKEQNQDMDTRICELEDEVNDLNNTVKELENQVYAGSEVG